MKPADEEEREISTEEFDLNSAPLAVEKKPNKILIYGIVAVAVAVLGILVAVLWKPVAELFGNGIRFDTPQEHFSYVERKAMDRLSDGVAQGYGTALARYDAGAIGMETEIHVLLDEDCQTLLAAYLGAGQDTDLSWLSDVMLNIDSSISTDIGNSQITLGLGNTPVVSADVIVDLSKYLMWLAVPELSSTYLKFDMQTLTDGYQADYDSEALTQLIDQLPSEQSIDQLLEKYAEIVLSGITEVESEVQTVTVDGVSQKCTVLTATVGEAQLIRIGIAALEAAREDVELLDVVAFSACLKGDPNVAEEWKADIDATLEDLNGALEQASDDNYLLWTDYVDDNHTIIGRRITVSDPDEEIYYLTAEDENGFAFEASILDTFVMQGSGTKVNGMVNAEYGLTVEGTDFVNIQVVDLDCNQLAGGDVCGTIRLLPTEDMMEQLVGVGLNMNTALECVLDLSGLEGSMEFNLQIGNERFMGVSVESALTDATAVKSPTNYLEADDESALAQWILDFDYDTIVDNLGKSGVPRDYLDAIEQLLEMFQENGDYVS